MLSDGCTAARQPAAPRVLTHHFCQLDGLRTLAVLGVIIQHTLRNRYPQLSGTGPAGVMLFFVLSGFLITRILLQARQQADSEGASRWGVLRAFYVRRLLRIFPLYYFALGVALVLAIADARQTWPWYAGYAANVHVWQEQAWGTALSHFWSLAVEEQFYLVWPALILWLPGRMILPVVVAAAASAPLLRLTLFSFTQSPYVGVLTPCCLDALGLGAVLALLWERGTPAQVEGFATGCLAVGLPLCIGARVLAFFGLLPPIIDIALQRNAFLALGSVWLVHHAARGFSGTMGRFLSWRPVVFLGTISYGLYVWHNLMPSCFGALQKALHLPVAFPESGVMEMIWVCVLATAASVLSWLLLERPINSLKRYFPYVRPAAASGRSAVRAAGLQPAGSGIDCQGFSGRKVGVA